MNLVEWLLMIAQTLVIWQLMWFFVFNEGRVHKWRLYKSCNVIRDYIKKNTEDGHCPIEVPFTYKNVMFRVGIIKSEVNHNYKIYEIFINGEDVAKYHCLSHDMLNSYYFEKTSKRDPDEVAKILHRCAKHIKKLERETMEKKEPDWKHDSYFK